MKTKVTVRISEEVYKTGTIDGYVTDPRGNPIALVIIDDVIHPAPLYDLKVIQEETPVFSPNEFRQFQAQNRNQAPEPIRLDYCVKPTVWRTVGYFETEVEAWLSVKDQPQNHRTVDTQNNRILNTSTGKLPQFVERHLRIHLK